MIIFFSRNSIATGNVKRGHSYLLLRLPKEGHHVPDRAAYHKAGLNDVDVSSGAIGHGDAPIVKDRNRVPRALLRSVTTNIPATSDAQLSPAKNRPRKMALGFQNTNRSHGSKRSIKKKNLVDYKYRTLVGKMAAYLSQKNKNGKRERQASDIGDDGAPKTSLDKAFHSILDGAADFLKTLITDLAKGNETDGVDLGDYPAAITLEEDCENPSKITIIQGRHANVNATRNGGEERLYGDADPENNEVDISGPIVKFASLENEYEPKIRFTNTSNLSDLRNVISEQLSKSSRLEKLRKFLISDSTDSFDDNFTQYPLDEVDLGNTVSTQEEDVTDNPQILIIADGNSDDRDIEADESKTLSPVSSDLIDSVKKRTKDYSRVTSQEKLGKDESNINKMIDCRICWIMDIVRKALDCENIVSINDIEHTEKNDMQSTSELSIEDTKAKRITEGTEGSSEMIEESEETEPTTVEQTEPMQEAVSESEVEITFKYTTGESKNNVTEEIDPDVYSPNIVHCETSTLGFCDTSVNPTLTGWSKKCDDVSPFVTYQCQHHCDPKVPLPTPWSGCKIGVHTRNANTITIISDLEEQPTEANTKSTKINKPLEIRLKTTKKTIKSKKNTKISKRTTPVWDKEALKMVKKARQMIELQTIKLDETSPTTSKIKMHSKNLASRIPPTKKLKAKAYQPVTISLHIDFDKNDRPESWVKNLKVQSAEIERDKLLSFVKNKKLVTMKARKMNLSDLKQKNKVKVLVQNGRVIGIIDKFGRLWQGADVNKPL